MKLINYVSELSGLFKQLSDFVKLRVRSHSDCIKLQHAGYAYYQIQQTQFAYAILEMLLSLLSKIYLTFFSKNATESLIDDLILA